MRRRSSRYRPLVEHARLAQSATTRNVRPVAAVETWQLEVGGRVQGVGFRPFVYGLATALGLTGEVCNRLGTVQILVTGTVDTLAEFKRRLLDDAPSLSRPALLQIDSTAVRAFSAFTIGSSASSEQARIFVPPDYFACNDCLAEMRDPGNRRYRYPFINCTQCGPRYTIINALPYDRPNTSMSVFPLCTQCGAEYSDPGDRRFHAEPIACPVCGPQLCFVSAGTTPVADTEQALRAALLELAAGRIVAVKGIGGYHLLCDAGNAVAVARLRTRKRRPDKPLAVMFPLAAQDELQHVQKSVRLSAAQADAVCSSARPIVLAQRRTDCPLAGNLAPGLSELGVFLPYSPLHALLLQDFGAPLVATSGNISGEPVLTRREEAEQRLANIADAFLHHDRGIVRPADDPVLRQIGKRVRPLRVGRGIAPVELTLPWRQPEPVLCVGGQQKATVTLSWDERAVVSPHIGDMDSPRSLAVFEQLVADLQSLHGIEATRVLCDAHQGYASARWARHQALPVTTIPHHRAHASALVAEVATPGPWLVFTWDGVGLGEDGTLWGGEALFGDAGSWRRVASFRPFKPPGGDRAGREPWRSAVALCWEAGTEPPQALAELDLAHAAWQKNLNAPATSAVGRLFDAASALVLGIHTSSFEAQGPMLLEASCRQPGQSIALPLAADDDGILRTDWAPLLPVLLEQKRAAAGRAEDFHATMAQVIHDQAVAVRAAYGVQRVGLSGGVFQNRVLTEQAIVLLQAAGFTVHLPGLLPCNDAGLSFGQAAEWAAGYSGGTA